MSWLIISKVFTILNLKIGQKTDMENQLSALRYKEDVSLGSLTLFANKHCLGMCAVLLVVRPLVETVYPWVLATVF